MFLLALEQSDVKILCQATSESTKLIIAKISSITDSFFVWAAVNKEIFSKKIYLFYCQSSWLIMDVAYAQIYTKLELYQIDI